VSHWYGTREINENMPFTFSNEEYADMHGHVYGFVTEALLLLLRNTGGDFRDEESPIGVFLTAHGQLQERGTFPSVSSPAERSVR
jgi:hypothetical protein